MKNRYFHIHLSMKKMLVAVCLLSSSVSVLGAEVPDCRQQKVEQSIVEICLHPGSPFQHDVYTLKLDKKLIFALVDDYVESISLEHTIPEGPAIEFPLSQQGVTSVKITGGCLPESKDGAEVARVCNIHWGRFHVVKDIRFEFE
jgi:hypothetical protein